jgi:hypothetical protein
MKNLKVGDFLFRVEGDVTSIAVITKIESIYFYADVIDSQPHKYEIGLSKNTYESKGWQLLDVSMLRSQS